MSGHARFYCILRLSLAQSKSTTKMLLFGDENTKMCQAQQRTVSVSTCRSLFALIGFFPSKCTVLFSYLHFFLSILIGFPPDYSLCAAYWVNPLLLCTRHVQAVDWSLRPTGLCGSCRVECHLPRPLSGILQDEAAIGIPLGPVRG